MSPIVNRRAFLRSGACGAAAGVLGLSGHAHQSAAPAPPAAPSRSRSGAEFINQETQAQIERGLEFLARSQYNDGSFPGGSVTDRVGTDGWAVGVTSIAALALMAGGNQPGRGKYGKHVARVDFLFEEQNLVVEVSGGRGHSTASDRAKDARRRNTLQQMGRTVLEFTYEDVMEREAYVVETLKASGVSRK